MTQPEYRPPVKFNWGYVVLIPRQLSRGYVNLTLRRKYPTTTGTADQLFGQERHIMNLRRNLHEAGRAVSFLNRRDGLAAAGGDAIVNGQFLLRQPLCQSGAL